MKYKITVVKESAALYIAYCPVMPDIRAAGCSMESALANIKQEMLCYLHDPSAQFEIEFEGYSQAASRHSAERMVQ